MTDRRKVGIFFAAMIVAIGGLVYELIIGTATTYLLGNSVLHFSLSIGIFLFGMGIGSLISNRLNKYPEQMFIWVEIILGLVGGGSVAILFSTFAFTNLIYLVFVLLVLMLGALIGLEIPLMLSIVSEKKNGEGVVKLASQILSLDYMGALVASILFPLLILPQLGLLRASFFIGMLNLLIAALMLASFWDVVKQRKLQIISLTSSFLILIAGFASSSQVIGFINKGIFQDEVIYNEQSSYQNIVLTKFNDDLRMFIDGNIQFSSIDEYRYHEPLVHIPFLAAATNERVLVLGGGDGMVLREVEKYDSVKEIKLVDLDPAIVRLSSTYPLITEINHSSFDDERVEVVHDDAFNYLKQNSELFDVIIIDLPDPNNEALAKLYSIEFYDLVGRSLAVGGVMITQATSPYFTTETFWTIENTVSEAGLYTRPLRNNVPSFGEWGFILASNRKINLRDQVSVETKLLSNTDVLAGLFVFDGDMARPEGIDDVSTLFDPQVLYIYEEEAREWGN